MLTDYLNRGLRTNLHKSLIQNNRRCLTRPNQSDITNQIIKTNTAVIEGRNKFVSFESLKFLHSHHQCVINVTKPLGMTFLTPQLDTKSII